MIRLALTTLAVALAGCSGAAKSDPTPQELMNLDPEVRVVMDGGSTELICWKELPGDREETPESMLISSGTVGMLLGYSGDKSHARVKMDDGPCVWVATGFILPLDR
jgi:hypothetical protein